MTVTKGKQKYTFPSSGNNSDVESLHLGSSVSASDTESLHEEGTSAPPPFLRPTLKSSIVEELLVLKKSAGRKKLRRYRNRCLLQTLAEEEESEGDVVIMESYKSPFAKLLEDEDALEFWDVFIHKSEEEQAHIIDKFSKSWDNSAPMNTARKDKPFSRISPKIRRTIKVKKNLQLELVKESEDHLVAFFRATPNEVYAKFPATYFDRLLLHAIAQYHGLQSLGMIEEGLKKVEVFNSQVGEWMPADCFLTDFVAKLRS